MSQLYLVRHGKSFWNSKNIFTGWVDVGLNKEGVENAITVGKKLANIKFDIVFTSELVRAIDTAMILLAYNKNNATPYIIHKKDIISKWAKDYNKQDKKMLPIYKSWRLNERYYGKLQGMNKDFARKKFGKEKVKLWRRSYDIAPPAGESLKDTQRRVLPFFKKKIIPALEKFNKVLVVAHGNSIRAIVSYIENLSEKEVLTLEIPFDKAITYTYSKGKFGRKRII